MQRGWNRCGESDEHVFLYSCMYTFYPMWGQDEGWLGHTYRVTHVCVQLHNKVEADVSSPMDMHTCTEVGTYCNHGMGLDECWLIHEQWATQGCTCLHTTMQRVWSKYGGSGDIYICIDASKHSNQGVDNKTGDWNTGKGPHWDIHAHVQPCTGVELHVFLTCCVSCLSEGNTVVRLSIMLYLFFRRRGMLQSICVFIGVCKIIVVCTVHVHGGAP